MGQITVGVSRPASALDPPAMKFFIAAALLATASCSPQTAFTGVSPIARRANTFNKNSAIRVPSGVSRHTMSAAADDFVPDMERRNVMNLLLAGAVGAPGLTMAGAYAYFFFPASSGGGGAGTVAKDALGNDVTFEGWLATHQAGESKLVQGLKGDATYLIVKEDKTIEKYGLNAVCTHLGCVVPWNKAENKFMCPCHGPQYNNEGKVVRGPAPLSLALAHVEDVEGKVTLSTWVEKDFRTGLDPWWT